MDTSITRPSKSKVSSDLTRLAIDNTPASPRRSRRASGLAPPTTGELYDTLELRNRTITEVYSPLSKIGMRSTSEDATTLDTSRRSRARSGAVTMKEKEESVRMEEEEGEKEEGGNMTVVELREELKSRGLSVAGNKTDLRRRLLDSSQLGLGSPLKSRSTPSKVLAQ